MDLKHIIPQQRRRTYGPSFDIAFSTDKSDVSRVGPNPVFSRASSGTFVNENGRIVGKTRSTTSLNPASVAVGGVAVFAVPSGSVVGWLNNSVVSVMEDTDGDDQIGAQRHVTGTLIHKTDTAITLLVTSKAGTTTLSSWFVSYRGLRNDHNPVTGLCLGALIEESRTNFIRGSEGLTTGWSVYNGATRTPNSTTSPDGSNSASLISFSALINSAIEQEVLSQPAGTYTYSLYMRADSPTTVRIGTLSPTVVCSVTTAWQRFTITSTTAATGTIYPQIFNSSSGGAKSIYVWGAQLEAGSFATSYIPTTAAATIRSADVYDITGSSFTNVWRQSGNTVYCSYHRGTSTTFGPIVTADTTSDVGKVQLNRASTEIKDNSNNIQFQYVFANLTSVNKSALSYETNNARAAANTILSPLDTSVTLGTPIQLRIGRDSVGVPRFHNGPISSVRVYRQKFSDAEIQALTAIISEPIVYNGVAIWYNGEGLIETN